MQHIIALAFMSVKRIIMMNWKVQKPNCSNTDNWLKHFMDLLSMERATSFLNDLDRGDEGLWILINYLIKTYRTSFEKLGIEINLLNIMDLLPPPLLYCVLFGYVL